MVDMRDTPSFGRSTFLSREQRESARLPTAVPPARRGTALAVAFKPTRERPGSERESRKRCEVVHRLATINSKRLESARLHPQIEFADQLVVVERVGRVARKGDLAVDDDIATIGDADRLGEVLLGHEHGELVALLQLLDLVDRP